MGKKGSDQKLGHLKIPNLMYSFQPGDNLLFVGGKYMDYDGFSLIFLLKDQLLTHGGFYRQLVHENSARNFFFGGIDLQLLRPVLVLVHLLRLVQVEVFHFHFMRRRGVRITCDHGNMVKAAVPTLHHPSSLEHKRSPAGRQRAS